MNRRKYKPFVSPVICEMTEEVANDYGEYLQTDHWREIREVVGYINHYHCEVCGKAIRMNEASVHHLNYKRLGCENMDDVVFLCKDCHEKVHGLNKLNNYISKLNLTQKKEAYEMLKERFGE